MSHKQNDLPGTRFRGSIPYTTQRGIETIHRMYRTPVVPMSVAKVLQPYSDRMTCDVLGSNGAVIRNVPVRTRGGLANNNANVYGEMELPAIGSWVTIEFLEGKQSMPMITGTILAYSHGNLQASQTPPNSGSKQYTKKLLEANKLLTYRKIFLSGTTVEVKDDGTIIVETPSGSFIMIDESNSGKTTISARGNTIIMDSGKVTINGNLEIDQ